ncbi:GNAT family N-acetyltransferase [Butyrivibrio sp. AE3004]|uniref:GNAT family N-acetyltransferase n=1 Tax=Butyrivibrio sp. AE3004 TaxID=1506994 RepID=UPI0009DF6BE8
MAIDGDKIIGTSGMSFVEKPPYSGCPSGKMGLLSSMFTDPAYRRQGIAKELWVTQRHFYLVIFVLYSLGVI